MKNICCTFLFFLPLFIQAQDSLTVEMDSKIKMIIDKRIDINKNKPGISGYRVQIFFGSQRNEATKVKGDFSLVYPQIDAYLIYQAPNFKVRVGDFRTRIEANKFYQEIVKLYPSVFIVEDDINLPKINSIVKEEENVILEDNADRKN